MQILEVLKKEHAEVNQLLEKIMDTNGPKARQKLFAKAKAMLLAHAHAEQQTFYVALQEHEETADLALEAEVEHGIVERLLQDMDDPSADPERWSAKCKVLAELVQHHVKEEEKEIFKKARKVLDKSQLQELAQQFEAAKEEQPAPAA